MHCSMKDGCFNEQRLRQRRGRNLAVGPQSLGQRGRGHDLWRKHGKIKASDLCANNLRLLLGEGRAAGSVVGGWPASMGAGEQGRAAGCPTTEGTLIALRPQRRVP